MSEPACPVFRVESDLRTTKTLDYKDAARIVNEILGEAAKLAKTAVVAVVDPHGELIAFARMDEAPVSSIKIAMNKAYTAARERKSTEEIGRKARDAEKGFDIAYFGDDRFVGWGGGVPVWRGGQVVGAIAVSGLPQVEDIRLANWAAGLVGD